MNVLFGIALRRTTGFVESLLRLIGPDWAVRDFSTLSRRQITLKVNIPYRGSDGPLLLLVDSTGIKVEREGEWSPRKHGGTKRCVWRKIRIGIGEKSVEIPAAEFTTSEIGDAPMLPELLDQIPPEQEIASGTADGAFDTRRCHDAIAARGAAAIIPPRKNGKPWKPDTAGTVARNEILETSKRVARAIWRRWSGYHRARSRVRSGATRRRAAESSSIGPLPRNGMRTVPPGVQRSANSQSTPSCATTCRNGSPASSPHRTASPSRDPLWYGRDGGPFSGKGDAGHLLGARSRSRSA
jgi:hypothetical protein